MQHTIPRNKSYRLRKILWLASLTIGIVSISLTVSNTSYAASRSMTIPQTFTCGGSPGINFPIPWSSKTIGASENVSCNSRADSISATADILQYNGWAWVSIAESGNGCTSCYNLDLYFTNSGAIDGDMYMVEGWFSASSGGLGQGESGYSSCWIFHVNGPVHC